MSPTTKPGTEVAKQKAHRYSPDAVVSHHQQ